MGIVATLAFVAAAGVLAQESITVVAPPSPFPPPVDPLVDMPGRVFQQTGAMPRECGRFQLRQVASTFEGATREQLQAAVRCARQAMRDRQPFWTFVQHRGIDSWGATGLLRTAAGELHIFGYDSTPCGGPGCQPRLSLQRCEDPAVKPAADGAAPDFTCRRIGPPQ